MDLAKANLKLANTANYLSRFNLNIFHIPGTLNVSLEGHALANTLYTVICKFSKKKLLIAGRKTYTAKE
ncbi:hypothetical protein VTH82DRAFT_2387 [Thermothelomyces myriococcoides]